MSAANTPDPFENFLSDPDPLPEDRPAYTPRRPSLLRRGVVLGAIAGTVFCVVVVPLTAHFFDYNPFRNPDLWREEPFTHAHGGPRLLYYTGRVHRDAARRLAAHLRDAPLFGGPQRATALIDREPNGDYVLVFFADPTAPRDKPPDPQDDWDPMRRRLVERLRAEELLDQPKPTPAWKLIEDDLRQLRRDVSVGVLGGERVVIEVCDRNMTILPGRVVRKVLTRLE